MFEWHGPGKLVFAWAASDALGGAPGLKSVPGQVPAADADPSSSPQNDAVPSNGTHATQAEVLSEGSKVLMITTIPPSSLYKQVVDERETVQFDVPAKAIGRIVGKDGANLYDDVFGHISGQLCLSDRFRHID